MAIAYCARLLLTGGLTRPHTHASSCHNVRRKQTSGLISRCYVELQSYSSDSIMSQVRQTFKLPTQLTPRVVNVVHGDA